MAQKRVAKKVLTGISSESFNESLSAYAVANAREQSINSKMDEQMTKIREKYADELKVLKETQEKHFEVVQVYCTENKEDLFPKKKSIDTIHGLVGFRTGTPKLKTLKGFTWASVLELLKVKMPDYVRKIEEPNKELLLADRNKDEVKDEMAGVGIKVDQDESFFIELKKEETESTTVNVQKL